MSQFHVKHYHKRGRRYIPCNGMWCATDDSWPADGIWVVKGKSMSKVLDYEQIKKVELAGIRLHLIWHKDNICKIISELQRSGHSILEMANQIIEMLTIGEVKNGS